MATPHAAAAQLSEADELRLLADQLARMRAMIFGYSERFSERIRTHLLLTFALMMGAVTIGYTAGAALLGLAGMRGLLETDHGALLVAVALAWTAAIALYLVATFVTRHDERRLIAALDAAYGPKHGPSPR